MAAQIGSWKQQEKRMMDEKIAKVREVVRNVNTNEVVLALHTYDMDVEATIRAFCEGGTDQAIGEWEQTGGSKQKNRGQSKKAKQHVPAPTPSSKASKNGAENGKPSTNTKKDSSASNSVVGHPVTNGYAGQANGYSAPNGTNNHTSTTQSAAGHQQKPAAQQQSQRKAQNNPSNGPSNGGVVVESKVKAPHDEATPHVSKYAGEMEPLKQQGASHANQSEAALSSTFRHLHNLLNEREQQLKSELAACRHDAAVVCNTSALAEIIRQFGQVSPNKRVDAVHQRENIPNGTTETRSYPRAHSPIRHHTAGEGRKSHQETAEVKANPATVEKDNAVSSPPKLNGATSSNGIVMHSDALSSDELAKLQRQIEETLKAQGIDPSVLADANLASAAAPPRRRPPPKSATLTNGHGGKGPSKQQNGSTKAPAKQSK